MADRAKIRIERTYHAPLDDIWELWTTKEGIESWWGPDEFFVTVRKLDLRVGGALEYYMTTKNADIIGYLKTAGMGPTQRVKARYTEIEPQRRLAYVTHADFVAGMEPEDISTVVEIQPAPGGAYRVLLTLDAFQAPEMNRNMELGWRQELEKLAKALDA